MALSLIGWALVRRLSDGGEGRYPVDLAGLRDRLAAAGAPEVEVRTLDPGIVELVGSPDEPELADRLVEIASRTRGVDVVVNRLWTPEEAAPRGAPSPSRVESGTN